MPWEGVCVLLVPWEGLCSIRDLGGRKTALPRHKMNASSLSPGGGAFILCLVEGLRAFCALGRVEVFLVLRQYSQTPNRKTNPELAPGFLR